MYCYIYTWSQKVYRILHQEIVNNIFLTHLIYQHKNQSIFIIYQLLDFLEHFHNKLSTLNKEQKEEKKVSFLIQNTSAKIGYLHKTHTHYLWEPLGEETVAVDFNQLTIAVSVWQANDQFLGQCFTERCFTSAWWSWEIQCTWWAGDLVVVVVGGGGLVYCNMKFTKFLRQ